MLTLFITGD